MRRRRRRTVVPNVGAAGGPFKQYPLEKTRPDPFGYGTQYGPDRKTHSHPSWSSFKPLLSSS